MSGANIDQLLDLAGHGHVLTAQGGGADLVGPLAVFNGTSDRYVNSTLAGLIQSGEFHLTMLLRMDDIAKSPVVFSASPATGRGHFQIRVLSSGKVRAQLVNLANATVAAFDFGKVGQVKVGVDTTISLELSGGLISGWHGEGGIAAPVLMDKPFNMAAGDAVLSSVCVGARLYNGAPAAGSFAKMALMALAIRGTGQ